jgi:hypothetical protein
LKTDEGLGGEWRRGSSGDVLETITRGD